jgi:hypothetical protein
LSIPAAPSWGRSLDGCYRALARPVHRDGARVLARTISVAGLGRWASTLGGGDHAILVASETGENYAVGEYKKALDQTLPVPVRKIVERQFQRVKRAHDEGKGMRDRLEASARSPSR